MAVHPHVRGEYTIPGTSSVKMNGSSPRAWGIQHPGKAARQPYRFIPTCVGNTWRSPCRRPPRPVHPHVRGEYRHPLRKV